jgi:alginate O-acetyltransferase complex protein AlgI
VIAVVAAAWLGLGALLLAAGVLTGDAGPVARMLAFMTATFLGMKAVVLAAARAAGLPALPPARCLLFTCCWFGMDPRAFARRRRPDAPLVRALLGRGLRNAAAGAVLLLGARAIGQAWAAPLLMVALSLCVHFGLFTLLAALFRACGFPVRLLFDAPWRASSPREFWTRRWNRGFAEMTALAVHRPLQRRLGRDRALLVSFLVSGLLHEIAISLPVRAGWGLPTLYFALQGLVACWRGGEPGRALTLATVVLPLPLLFHPWFIDGVVVPLLG